MTFKSRGYIRITVITYNISILLAFFFFIGSKMLKYKDSTGIPPSWNSPRDNLFCFAFRLDLSFSIQHTHTVLKALTLNSNSNKTNLKPIALPSISSLGFDIV